MKQPPRKPSLDPYRKARFREEARGIVFKDRDDRKYGRAVDTAGAIGRALERAYRQGFADAQDDPAPKTSVQPRPDGPLDWALIPPRPRSAFWSFCLFTLGRGADVPRSGHLEPALTERGTQGWRPVVDGFERDKVIGANSIAPLVRLGLLKPDSAGSGHLTISPRGHATWRYFVQAGGQFPEDDVPPMTVPADPGTMH
jgi:hypothetical protein